MLTLGVLADPVTIERQGAVSRHLLEPQKAHATGEIMTKPAMEMGVGSVWLP